MAASLALWITLLPFISSVHMALVPHVYSTEHRHFHEVVTPEDANPTEDTDRATASFVAQSPAPFLTSIEECPLCDLALRQSLVTAPSPILAPNDCVAQSNFPAGTITACWPVLYRAPKHSPPLLAA